MGYEIIRIKILIIIFKLRIIKQNLETCSCYTEMSSRQTVKTYMFAMVEFNINNMPQKDGVLTNT